jgi:hypothetical protein
MQFFKIENQKTHSSETRVPVYETKTRRATFYNTRANWRPPKPVQAANVLLSIKVSFEQKYLFCIKKGYININ